MLLEVYSSDGTLKCGISPNDSSTQEKEIGGDNILSLSFTLYGYVELAVNDYIDFRGERYWLTEEYRPAEKSSQEWEYNVKFYGIESLIKRFLVLNTVATVDNPAVFTLTATPAEHLALVVQCINDGMGTDDWKVGEVTGSDNIVVDYEGTYCNEALEKIAGQVGDNIEWWVEGQTVNIGRCEQGEEIELGYGAGLTGMEQATADNVKFYSRLYAIGSTRNIDPETYGYMRLMLPGGAAYRDVEGRVAQYGIIHHYESDAFSDIYPRRIGTVSSVRSEEVKDSDGDAYKIYYFKDDGLDFDPNDYELAGKVKRVSFQSGELAGLGSDDDHYFEVNYDSSTKEFEIITIWPYDDGTQLPNDILIPKEGDTYILWNIRMPDEYYPIAEQEFSDAVDAYNDANCIDPAVYKCPTNYLWVERKGADLHIGRRVKLMSDKYWPDTGYRSSRITKITRKVTLPAQMDLEIGDALSTGSMSSLQSSIDNVRSYAKGIVNGISLPIIKTGDSTQPTDSNIFSARRSKKEFLSKIADDIAAGYITFEQGLTAVGLSIFKDGAEFGTFVKSLYAGKGAGIDADGNAEFESVRVRTYFEAMGYIVNRLSAIEGDQLLTEADTITSVVDLGDSCYGLYLQSKWDGYFTAQVQNNVLKGIMNTLAEGSGTYYTCWMRVNSVNSALNYIEVTLYPDDETPAGKNYPPCEMMKFARWGNQTDTTRQRCIYLSSTEGRICLMNGVTKPIPDTTSYGLVLGELPEFVKALNLPVIEGYDYIYARGLIVQDIIRIDVNGKPIVTYVDRGQWSADGTYYCETLNPDTGEYETSDVWYMGCKWRCCKNGTTTTPAWNNTDWAMIEGNPEFTVDFEDTNPLYDFDNFNAVLTIVAKLYNIDVTADILDTDVVWTRYSEDADGVERASSDNIWALRRAGSGKSITLGFDDIDYTGSMPKVLRFIATVTLRDGEGEVAATASASFSMG